MDFLQFLKNNIVVLDGAMGTLLQQQGLGAGEMPELWNKTHADVVSDIHKLYFDAGSNVVCTNTFGANLLKFSPEELDEIIFCALENAKKAKGASKSDGEKYIALDVGPLGRLLKPLGDLDFEEAVEIFAKTVSLGAKYGADLVLIETMNDSYETKAALLAAKENSSLPVIVTNAYGEDGKLMTGADPAAMVAMLEGLGADAVGANCSLGPVQLKGVAHSLAKCACVPVVMKPNAGLPKLVDGKTVFDITPDEFVVHMAELVQSGVRVVGGCCGTTPEYIKLLSDSIKGLAPLSLTDKNLTTVSSYTHAVNFGHSPLLIGERINPTGKKRFKEALVTGDIDYILSEGVKQQEAGAHILDVNVGLPEIDEKSLLKNTVYELQAIIDLPLQIDTSDPAAMEAALRLYNGKAMINSVNGKKESMASVFPLVKKYGGVVVALTLDENGIPETAEGRFEIAKKILATAAEYGISKKDIVFDTLTMTISTDTTAAKVTLDALKKIKDELGCNTTLGVSNISFGLPNRDVINSVFFTMALENGLSGAIMNPHSAEMMKVYHTYRALSGYDENCSSYIEAASSFVTSSVAQSAPQQGQTGASQLQSAIIKGFRDKCADITKELLKTTDPIEIITTEIIPALDVVGKGFENKTIYLPQLLMSAESAKSAFTQIKAAVETGGGKSAKKGKIIIATVHGDIHDIGKNIVKLLLENYNFEVIDLGKDVRAEKIVEAVLEKECTLVGLSALMTTTVPAMEETIKLIKSKAPDCRVIVGGAVLTKEYADKIGADKYAKDAMEAVRYADELFA